MRYRHGAKVVLRTDIALPSEYCNFGLEYDKEYEVRSSNSEHVQLDLPSTYWWVPAENVRLVMQWFERGDIAHIDTFDGVDDAWHHRDIQVGKTFQVLRENDCADDTVMLRTPSHPEGWWFPARAMSLVPNPMEFNGDMIKRDEVGMAADLRVRAVPVVRALTEGDLVAAALDSTIRTATFGGCGYLDPDNCVGWMDAIGEDKGQ